MLLESDAVYSARNLPIEIAGPLGVVYEADFHLEYNTVYSNILSIYPEDGGSMLH
jgi:hypothetical protein